MFEYQKILRDNGGTIEGLSSYGKPFSVYQAFIWTVLLKAERQEIEFSSAGFLC